MSREGFHPGQPEQEKIEGRFSVERKFSVMHYESPWPPEDQRERGVQPEKKSRYMSDLLTKKVIRGLREELSSKMFTSVEEVKRFIVAFIDQHVLEDDFGEMASVKPTVTERIGRGKKFIEIHIQWLDPNKDQPGYKNVGPSAWKHINDPWFSVRVVEKQ